MYRVAFAAVFATVFAVMAVPTGATTNAEWKEIVKALDGIPTVEGISVYKRIGRCGIKTERDASFMDVRPVDRPEYDAKAGQTVLKVVLDMPQEPPGSPKQSFPAIWVIDAGKARPISTWAMVLQNRPSPLGYTAKWMEC